MRQAAAQGALSDTVYLGNWICCQLSDDLDLTEVNQALL